MRVFLYLFLALIILSCEENEDYITSEKIEEINNPDVLIFKDNLVDESLVLVNDAGNNRVYLIEKKTGEVIYEWKLPAGIGTDAELLEDGNLLVALTVEDPAYSFGGFGGRMAIIDPQGSIIWDYTYSDEINLSHHDIEMLPNGNVLFLAWEKINGPNLQKLGYIGSYENVYLEKIVEINPRNNNIVWEWHVKDHLIQDQSPELENFGIISDFPQKIDINYEDSVEHGSYNGDIFHANAIEFDENRNLIYLSVNFFSEVWVIDHSTTIEESASQYGGNYGKGGDLVYRFGNPETYDSSGSRLFYHNHNPNIIPGENKLLIYSNGLLGVDDQSNVYELELPEYYDLVPNALNELKISWSFSDPELFSAKVSGAYRLENGNTLITQGTFGFWEVTRNKEVVWKYKGDGFFWRGYPYKRESEAIKNLGL